jgi:hypothetical protein
MTTSSPQTTCWQGSTDYSSSCHGGDTITITSPGYGFSSSDTITFTNSCYPSTTSYTIPTLTTAQIGTLSGSTISSISIDTSAYKINLPQEWVNCFPDFDRIEKMCKEYPGLAIAFEKFKTVYKLVKDHYDTPEDQRPRP